MTDFLNNNSSDDNSETLDIVGEGKQYATLEALAKGKLEADRTIKAREAELASLREEYAKQKTAEQLLEEITKRTANQGQAARDDNPGGSPAPLNEETLDARIREAQNRLNREEKVRANLQVVDQRLRDVFGTDEKVNEVVRTKAEELGVSVQFLRDVAANSPKAFFNQVGIESSTPNRTPTGNRTEVNPGVLQSTTSGGPKPGSYGYYEALRKSDPVRFWKPEIQNQLMRDAQAASDRGEDFYAA